MRTRRNLTRLFLTLLTVLLVLSSSAPLLVYAQDPATGGTDIPTVEDESIDVSEPPEGPAGAGGPRQDRPDKPKITAEDRKAAAERAEAAGFERDAVGTAAMNMGEAPRYFSHPNYANSPLPGNAVAEWNAIAQDILQPAPMPGMPMPMGGTSMSAAFVYLSYVQAAIYDALVAIEGGYQPYNPTPIAADPTASREGAVATAAYAVLKHYFPDEPTLDAKYAATLAAIPDGATKTAGIAVGQAAADGIIALRVDDGLLAPSSYTVPAPGPGVWEPTMMLPDGTMAPPVDPWMAVMKPFLRALPEQYRPLTVPDLTSAEYAADLNEVKDYGGAVSALRTPEQAAVAQFWATNMVIQTNAAYRQVAADRGLNLLETARLMAMGNMVATDSLIATFDVKYTYNFWRPVTAIQRADTDGNDATVADPTWVPLVTTPNFPEYVAGHGSFVSSQAGVFENVLGTPQIEIDLDSTATNSTRHYATVDDLRTEIVNARTWGGMHFRTSTVLAVALGQQLVTDALATHFLADATSDTGAHAAVSGGIRKFVDGLPGLTAANANNLGQYIPVAEPDTTTYPGSDYYEIAVIQYREQMHSDLPPTTLRGYVQLATAVVPGDVPLSNELLDGTQVPTGYTGVTEPHYLGPTIQATKDRPVRIKFYNLLPTGVDGDLFIPVDTTVMGSGMGPDLYPMTEMDPQNPMCGMDPKPAGCYAENRATLHLHGGISPWISDGTPHQWVTPAGDNTSYPQGVSVVPVPDMNDSGAPDDGVMTFYYTNQQSARLMFYHDHSYGITRLNVYAGEAAPYLITDATEQSLLDRGLIPGADSTIPLVVQDKTFVPSEAQLATQDETWDMTRWGGPGGLWLPHVYSPAQNPGDSEGVNAFGRWMYGPWFWPPTNDIDNGPIANPYYDPNCDASVQWCEPPLMPGTPYNSMGMEAFMDTPIVNGTAYPTVTIDPKTYRFRVLNAANDRFFNLSFYKAVDANGLPCDPSNPTPAPESTGVTCTEVALNPDEVAAALTDTTIFPTPLLGMEGPSWIHIGSEGGFLPAPVQVPAQPTTWVNDPTVFNAGNVDQHSLLLGPAERADVIVDFSAFAGQTLILYNDAPAAFPARDPRYDYYTGSADLTDIGGVPSILAGYGPNTRTVMKVVVADVPAAPAYDLPALEAAFVHQADGSGVFESGQHPIIVGQAAYNSAYGTSFRSSAPLDGFARIQDHSLTFATLSGTDLTMPLEPKQIQDEMGESFEHAYGRMSGFLGVEMPFAQAGLQNMILYPYAHPPSEVIDALEVPQGAEGELDVTPIAAADDGTQIWKITHNGVDTHPIHWHLYEVQLLNRVGWDGIIRTPEAGELGWKETVRVSPLEDTIVALRPIIPHVPFDLPNSVRLLDPTMPEGAWIANTTQQEAAGKPIFAFAPNGEPIDIINHYVNYGWEYVWHCHILSHEEMDMMRPQVVGVTPRAPGGVAALLQGSTVTLTWMDNSLNETAFILQRANDPGFATGLTTIELPQNTTTYADKGVKGNQTYYYRLLARNVVGDTWDYSDPNLNEGASFPTLTLDSAYSDAARVGTPPAAPAAPTNLAATVQAGPQVGLTWRDRSNNETGFVVERATDGVTFGAVATLDAGVTQYTDTAVAYGNTYTYRVAALNAGGSSAYSNLATVTVVPQTVPAPAAPTNLAAQLQAGPQVALTWRDRSNNETSFAIERSRNGGSYIPLNTVGANVTSYIDRAVSSGSTYVYRVQALNAGGASAWSNLATISLPSTAAPANVVGVAALQGTGARVQLNWADFATNEVGFEVQLATDTAFTKGLLTATVGPDVTTFATDAVSPGKRYYARVRTLFDGETSAWSDPATVTIQPSSSYEDPDDSSKLYISFIAAG